MMENGKQHPPYREACEEVITDEDGRRWVREGAATCPSWADGVPVPVDKNGNVVPLDARELVDEYDDKREVAVIGFWQDTNSWFVKFGDDWKYVPLDECVFVPPDSLKSLADDLGRYVNNMSSCSYFGMADNQTCDDCPASGRWIDCASSVLKDVARRVAALREAEKDED